MSALTRFIASVGALAGLVFLFVVSSAEASSARFFQQQVRDGKAASVRAEDAHDGVSRRARITGRVPCVDGEAAGYPCKDLDLLAFFPREDMGGFCPSSSAYDCFNDIWGWTDPVTGVEYALLGGVYGAAFFDLRDPENPLFVGTLPMTPGSQASWWRDIKVVNDHAVIVADAARSHGMQVFDLAQLRDVTDAPVTFEPTALYDAFESAHNVVVNDISDHVYIVGIGAQQAPSGFSCGAGPHIVDMSDPAQPVFAGCYDSSVRGRTTSSYTHDAQCVRYNGQDARYAGKDICFTADETGGAITDVTDPASPEELGVFGYPNPRYTHQGWLTEDHRYLFVNDELDEGEETKTRTLIFDVEELDDPVFVGAWYGPTTAADHNLYIRGDRLYEANYTAGLRVMDISYDGELSLDDIREVAYFDVHPASDAPSFDGAWSSYPYFESGIIAVSSINDGLFVLAPPSLSVGVSAESEELPVEVVLLGNYPNPFNPETTIRYALPQAGRVRLTVYDLLGQEVAVLVDGSLPAGHHTVRFDGGNLPSGSYVYRLQVGEEVMARTMTLVK